MQSHLTVVTLGVADLPRARGFYCDGLRWTASSASNEHVVFIQAGRIVLALFPRSELAKDACLDAAGSGFGGITLAHNVASKSAVDAGIADAERAGARILKRPQDTFWGGYSGYFADPDGHAWEVAFNPFWTLLPDGSMLLPGQR